MEVPNKSVNELDNLPSDILIRMVRDHKHEYSDLFGRVVSSPAKLLFKQFLNNPDSFSLDERKKIIDAYTYAIQFYAMYEQIGLSVGEQLNKIKKTVIPKIKDVASFYEDILLKHELPGLVSILKMSLDETDDLCQKLSSLETTIEGQPEVFDLHREILDTFNKDIEAAGIEGGESTMIVDTFFGSFRGVKVYMNRDGFKTHVIGNIIKNLHDHAFKDSDTLLYSKDFASKDAYIKSNGITIRTRLFSLFRKIFCFWCKEKKVIKSNQNYHIKEKLVKIEFKEDNNNSKRINIFILNNGTPFLGDTSNVFEDGIGEGTGFGLYSAKKFLEAYDASIRMVTNIDEDYKVGFIINLPII